MRQYKHESLAGRRFGRLAVLREVTRSSHGHFKWLCRCDCGNATIRSGHALKYGASISCGCTKIEAKTIHGYSRTPTYISWSGMIQRCYDSKHENFKHYGGRGITVCERWRNSFADFLLDMGEKPRKHSIDRIDNNGNYEPKNCRWLSHKEQSRNKRTNVLLAHKGRTQCIQAWADELGIDQSTICARMKLGWRIERVLSVDKWGTPGKNR